MVYIFLFLLGMLAHDAYTMEYFNKFFKQSEPVVGHITPPLKKTVVAKVAAITIGQETEFKQIMDLFERAYKDTSVYGIVLLVDCRGGSGAHFSMVHDLIKKVREKKPVVCVVYGHAFSGGYMVACACDYILLHSMTEIGGIGSVIEAVKYSNSKITGKVEAQTQVELFYSGKYKMITNPYHLLQEEEREYIQKNVDENYREFLALVAQDRGLDLKHQALWADARIFMARKAIELGLADSFGTVLDAQELILELIKEKNPQIIFDPEVVSVAYEEKKSSTPSPAPTL